MLKTFFRWIGRLWSDVTAGPAMRERLALSVEQVNALKNKLEKLQEENGKLLAEGDEMKSKLAALAARDQFINHCGILFKPSEIKKLSAVPYCPNCLMPMSAPMAHVEFRCSRCKVFSQFAPITLPGIVSELAKEIPD